MLTDSSWVERCRRAGRPLIFAHRGGAGLAPENTLTAFQRAHALGVDGFELDVRLTRDGEVVAIHDDRVDRTTDGTGPVASMTVDALQQLDAGFRFQPVRDGHASGEFPFRAAGVRVPLLRDVLEQFPDMLLVIELKGHDPDLATRAFDAVRDAGAVGRVCFGGYHKATLRRVRQLGSGRRAAVDGMDGAGSRLCSSACREETRWALYRSWLHLPWPWVSYDAFQVPETSGRTRVVSPRFLQAAHALGQLVQVWTVNEEADMRRLLGWGVDGLISDVPDVALRVRNAVAVAPR